MTPDSNDSKPKKETGFLGSTNAKPMPDRMARPQTNILGPAWRLQFKIEDHKLTLSMDEILIVGRSAEDSTHKLNLDLAQFSGYQNGVSRQHAAITRHQGGLYIEDLDSTNGTRINGFQLTVKRKYRLRDGDEVEFARLKTLIKFITPE